MRIARNCGVAVFAFLIICVASSCQQRAAKPAPQVDLTAMKAAFEAVWNDGQIDRYDEICTPDCVAHEVGSGQVFDGLDAIKAWTPTALSAYPDVQWRIDDIFAAGDKVVALWSWNGTNTAPLPAGPFYPETPATGKVASGSGVAILHVVDGKVAEWWSYYDSLAPMLQLGFTIKPPAETAE